MYVISFHNGLINHLPANLVSCFRRTGHSWYQTIWKEVRTKWIAARMHHKTVNILGDTHWLGKGHHNYVLLVSVHTRTQESIHMRLPLDIFSTLLYEEYKTVDSS